jgi:CBS domain containing-hemolysin-like protein
LAMEDIIETIIGQEIFEHDDMAVDMREFAKRKHKARIKEEKTQANEKPDSST